MTTQVLRLDQCQPDELARLRDHGYTDAAQELASRLAAVADTLYSSASRRMPPTGVCGPSALVAPGTALLTSH